MSTLFGGELKDPNWESKLWNSTRLSLGQKEDLTLVIAWDFYQKRGGQRPFAKFGQFESEAQIKEFGEAYNLIKWELTRLGFWSTVDLPRPVFHLDNFN